MAVALFFGLYYPYKWLRHRYHDELLLSRRNDLPEPEVKKTLTAAGDWDPTLQNEMLLKMVDVSVKCPICLEIAIPPLVQCSQGHFTCSVCRPNVDKCGLCRSKFTEARNFAIENIVATMYSKCGYSGCTEFLQVAQVREHMMKCAYRPKLCPHCHFHRRCLVELENYTKHLKEVHNYRSMNIIPGTFCTMSFKPIDFAAFFDPVTVPGNSGVDNVKQRAGDYVILTIPHSGDTFLANFEVEDSNAFMWISALSPHKKRYVADLSISNKQTAHYKYAITINVASLRMNSTQLKYSKYCAVVPIRSLLKLSTLTKLGGVSLQVALRTG